MSSVAAAPIATPLASEFSGDKGAHLKPSAAGAAPDGALKSPDLVNPTDIELVKSMTGEDFNKWKSLYSQADQYQQLLKKGWKEYREQNLTKPDLEDDENEYLSPDLQELKKNHKEYIGNAKTNLKALAEVNDKIRALNKDRGRHDAFGTTSIPFMHPCLEKPEQWDRLQKKLLSRRDYLLKITECFSMGYSLQLIFNHGSDALDKNFDKAYVEKIGEAIKSLNASIRTLKLDKKVKTLGFMSIPTFDSLKFEMPEQTMQEDEDDDSGDSDDEEYSDVASGDEDSSDKDVDMGDGSGDRPEVPEQIMKVLTSMGGDGGLLQRVLLALDERFQIPDQELAAKFQKYQEKVRRLTLKAGIDNTGTLFQINLGQLKMGISKTQDAYRAIRDDPGNEVLQQEYQALRKEAADFMAQFKYPENFVDAVAPSAQGIIDEFKARTAPPPLDPLTRYAPELDKIMERFGGQDGCLSKYLHSKADGNIDKDAETEVLKIKDEIYAVLGPDDSGLLDGDLRVYNFSEGRLEEHVELVKMLKGLEKKSEADPSNDNKFNLGSALESTKETLGHKVLCEAIIGDIETSQRFLGANKPPKPPKISARHPKVKVASLKKKVDRTIHAPSEEDDPSHFLSAQSNPRVVFDVIDGRMIEKRIMHVKRIKKTVNKDLEDEIGAVVGWHLLLKYHDTDNHECPSFEMVPGSLYPGAVQAFLKDGGTEFVPGTREDLRGISASDIKIVGVVRVGNPGNKKEEINISGRLLLRVFFISLNKSMFFTITTLRDKYGTLVINRLRDGFVSKSGQTLQVALSRAEEREKWKAEGEKWKAEVAKLKDEKLEIALGNLSSKRRSERLRKQHHSTERVVVDDNDGDDGDDSDDSDYSGGSDDSDEDEGSGDDQDLEGFVVPDEGVSEEVANKNSELLFLKGELDRLKDERRTIQTQMKKKNVSDKKVKKMKKKIEKISANIQETKELITGVEEELDALKEDDDGDSSSDDDDDDDDDETTQLKAGIEDARRRGQMAKVKVLERRLAAM